MGVVSLEAQAAKLGIPMKVKVDDGLRYSYCDAHMATLISIEGTHAVYKGVCANRHKYSLRMKIEELQNMARIEGGEVVYGAGKGFKAEELEEF